MATLELRSFRWTALAVLLLLSSALSACADQQAAAAAEKESLCPSCKPLAGGETSDFGSYVGVCGAVLERVSATKAQAEALGLDIAGAKKLIERDVDMPMTWSARETKYGEPATGYDGHETRVRAKLTVVDSYTHRRRSPKYCEGTKCTYEGMTEECPVEFLFLHFKVDFDTLDGAVQTSADGEVGLWTEPGHELVGEVSADLHAATGSLRMYPDVPEPHAGVLSIEFLFKPEGTEGAVWPKVLPIAHGEPAADGGAPASDFLVAGYEPLQGTWPCHEETIASDNVYCNGAVAAVGAPTP